MRSWRRFAGAPQLSVPDSRCQEGDRRRRGGQRAVANVAIAAFCAAFAAVYAGRCCRRFQYASKLGGVTSSSFSMRASMNARSEEHTSELQSLMRTSYAVFCLQKKTQTPQN